MRTTHTDTVVGWITVFASMVACAGPPAIIANMITSFAIFYYDNYEPKTWHMTLLMWALIIFLFVFNLRFRKLLNVFEVVGGFLHFVFFVSIITLSALAKHSTTDFVFKTLTTGPVVGRTLVSARASDCSP